MKLLLLIDDYFPYSTKVAAKMMHELAVHLHRLGNEIWVLTPASDQPRYSSFKVLDGINIVYFQSGKIKNSNKYKRTFNEALLPYRALKAIRQFSFSDFVFHAIIYYSPSIFWGSLVKKLARRWNCNSYLILRDIFPQWAVDSGLLSKYSIPYMFFKYHENITYKYATRIGVMSPSILLYFKNKGYDISKFEVLFNWSKLDLPKGVKKDHLKRLELENKIIFFYGGNIGYAQHILYLTNLAKRLLIYEQVHFLFVGSGDEVPVLLHEIDNHSLLNITYLPPVNQETYSELLSEIHVGIFSLHPDHITDNFPGKLLGYMAASKPILGCVNSGNDLKGIINDTMAGIVVNSGDDDDFYLAALKLIESEEMRVIFGQNSRRLLEEKFSVEMAGNKILSSFL